MALKSTIYKADCQISDMDRGYYQSHHLTIALHPSDKFAWSEFEQPMAARRVKYKDVFHQPKNA